MRVPNVKFNHCVVTIITDGMGKMLFIKRKDGPWSLCAGHIENSETPEAAARREIYEETGLTPEYLSIIHKHDNPSVFFFSAQCTGVPHGRNDPDNEGKPQWVDITRGIPTNIYNNISGPKDDSNILKQLFGRAGLKKSEFEWSEELGFLDLSKGDMQRLFPFDPIKEKEKVINNSEVKTKLNNIYNRWTSGNDPYYRGVLANNLSLEARNRGLHRLHSLTQVRRNPITNEREFLLHRAHNTQESFSNNWYENKNSHSSWTPDKEIADGFYGTYIKKYPDNINVSSAWIPESSIKAYVPILGNKYKPKGAPSMVQEDEKEVIVAPGKYELYKE